MRRFIYLAIAVSVALGYSGSAAGMAGSTAVEEKLDALTDAVCVQAVVLYDLHNQSGRTTPKACREAPHIVFVSSATFSAPGGVGDAATKCNQLAADVGLPGIYKAWITGHTNPDSMPPAFRFARSFGPYVLVDGTLVASDWDDLADGTLTAAIDLNEKGGFTSVDVWTNVSTDGMRLDANFDGTCGSFRDSSSALTGIFGVSTQTGAAWTNSGVDTCDKAKALYCFGQ